MTTHAKSEHPHPHATVHPPAHDHEKPKAKAAALTFEDLRVGGIRAALEHCCDDLDLSPEQRLIVAFLASRPGLLTNVDATLNAHCHNADHEHDDACCKLADQVIAFKAMAKAVDLVSHAVKANPGKVETTTDTTVGVKRTRMFKHD